MDELPINIIQKITKKLTLKEYKSLSLCNKSLYNDISSLYQNNNFIHNIHSYNIFDIYSIIHEQHDELQKIKNNIDYSIKYDIEWCLSRFHSERMNLTKYSLTYEQKEIINVNCKEGDIVLIQAFAGTGKTTTLINVAKKYNNKKVLYLTFNKSLCESAKNITGIDHVTISTIHSLALSLIDPTNKYTIGKIDLNYIENAFNVDRIESSLIKKIMENFFASNSKYISEYHISSMNLGNDKYFLDISNELWNHMINSRCKMPHDGYLKLFQISNPILQYDIILLDEVQDSTECILQIIKKQKNAIRYLVGDIHQQIYGFRNVCNVFDGRLSNNIYKFTLSQSFRYGYQIAHIANLFLETFKNENKKIYSYGMNTNILLNTNTLNEQYTIITRTNICLMKECFKIDSNKKIFILGKRYNFEKECLYALGFSSLQNGLIPHVSKLQFNSFSEMRDHFLNLKKFKWTCRINLYLEYGIEIIEKYRQLQEQIVFNIDDADIVLTTTHQAKGLEFNNVKLSDDFIPLVTTLNTIYKYKSNSAIEGYNILYVAITRAKKNLILNKELYNFLQILKGKRIVQSPCKICNNISLKEEIGITSIGFDSKPLYITQKKTCYCNE